MFNMDTRMRMAGELFAENVRLLEKFSFDELKGVILKYKDDLKNVNSKLNTKDEDGIMLAKHAGDNLIYYVMRIQRTPEWKKLSYDKRQKIIGNLDYREHRRAMKYINNVLRGRPIISGKHIAHEMSKIDIDHYGERTAPDMSRYVSNNLQRYLATTHFRDALN